ncbi:aspartate aminotransferase family protein [Bacteroidota bacterium]
MTKEHLIPFLENGFVEISRSQGCYLFDPEGNQYLDLESGIWCVNLGHNHIRINKAITRQLNTVFHLGYQVGNKLPGNLSEELLHRLKLYDGKSVFLSSGSEAVELAIVLARKISGRKKICKLDNSYLSAFGFGSVSEHVKYQQNIPNNDYTKLVACNFRDMAAFVFEPGTAGGTIRFPSVEFISALVSKARNAGCLIIVDEVTTGMGRTGKWFGFEHYNITPDIVVCGKGLGNGYPISSVSVSKEMSKEFDRISFRYAQSHQNDPMGCAIGLAVINEIEKKGLLHICDEKGILFKELLKEVMNNQNRIHEIRGRGLMLAIEFQDAADTVRIHQSLLENRIITGLKGATIRLMPPLVINQQDIHPFVEKLNSILSEA